ncbi:Uncharacterised protein [Serratia ficaria]|nr:Uncharacterised protein [Serratia ficaria]
MQLAHRPQRHRLPAFVQQVNPRVGDRPADRHRRQPRLAGAAPGGDVHRRLGRPVQVMQLHLRQPPVERRHQRRRQRFPAAHYPPHLLAARRRPLVRQEALQHRGHEVQRGDAVLGYRPAQVVRILVPLRLRHHQLRPDHQRPEELPHRHVEAERRFLQHPVLRRQAVGLLHPQQPVDHPAVFVHRPLRLAGRPRGVNHVRQVRRLRPRLRVVAAQLAWQRLVQRQLRHLVRRQRRPPGGVRQQQQRLGILQDVLQALARVGRIQRHVGAAGLEDAKQRGDHRQAALGAHRHPAVRPHAAGDKPMRQPVGAGVQLGVAQAFPAADHRHRLRGALHLLLEQRLQRLVQRVVPAGVVPAIHQQFALRVRYHGQAAHRRVRRLLQRLRQRSQRLRHIAADPFRADRLGDLRGHAQRVAAVLHRQHERIVGALLGAQQADAFRQHRRFTVVMAIVKQGAEQRRARADAAAALRQRQRRMLVGQQPAQPGVRLARRRRDAAPIDIQTQRQGIDKQPQRPLGAFAPLQTPQQHGAEHHRVASAGARQHLRPGQMAQAGQAHAQAPGLPPQPQVQRRRQSLITADHLMPFAVHVAQAKRQHRLVDIRQHLAEEALMLDFADAQPRLRHRIAERLRRRQLRPAPGQDRAHFLLHKGQGRVIANQVVPLLQCAPAAVFLLRHPEVQQRRAAQIRPLPLRIKAGRQLLADRSRGRIETQLAQRQLRLAPHHLHR